MSEHSEFYETLSVDSKEVGLHYGCTKRCRVTSDGATADTPFSILCGRCTAILVTARRSVGAFDADDHRFIVEGNEHRCSHPHTGPLVIVKDEDELTESAEVLRRALEDQLVGA